MQRFWLVSLVLLLGCPERRYPERGTQLVYRKSGTGDPRPAVERRLAKGKIKAHLAESSDELTVRIPEGGDVARAEQLLKRRAKLELCEESLVDDADAGARLVSEKTEDGTHTYSAFRDCFEPTVLEATLGPPLAERQVLNLVFDGPSSDELATLTAKLLRKRLLVLLDGELIIAPTVMEPIPSGKMQLPGRWTAEEAAMIALQVEGGPVSGLTLVKNVSYGPPTLSR